MNEEIEDLLERLREAEVYIRRVSKTLETFEAFLKGVAAAFNVNWADNFSGKNYGDETANRIRETLNRWERSSKNRS